MSGDLRKARLLALAAPALLLGGAYVSQYGFGLYPCQMCWWQRYAHVAALAFAVLACLRPASRAPILLAALAIGASGLIGGFHAGVEYGWWHGFTACTTTAAAGGDPLQAILDAPLVRCDVAPWSLFSISLAGWNFVFSLGAAIGVWVLASRGGRAGT